MSYEPQDHLFRRPVPLRRAHESVLAAREAENNLVLGLTATLRAGEKYGDEPPYFACVVDAAGLVVACALRTPPHNLVVSLVDHPDALGVLVGDLHERYPDLSGVTAERDVARQFAGLWCDRTRQSADVLMQQRIHRAERIRPPDGVSGEMRDATPDDGDLLDEWIAAFEDEAIPAPRERRVRTRSDDRPVPGRRRVLWWDEGRPVSLAGYTGPTPNGIRIAPVYTPPDLRGRGYAGACVAALSQRLLDEGRRFCFLFTDLANPVSNRLYARIGYEPVCDVDQYRFEGYRPRVFADTV